MALAVAVFAPLAQAAPSFKTVREMPRECIADDLFLTGSCSGYSDQIDTLESTRRARGADPCFAGHVSKDDVAKQFVRALLADYTAAGTGWSPSGGVVTMAMVFVVVALSNRVQPNISSWPGRR
jgi:hypothetical protein